MGSNLKKIRSLNLNIKISSIGILISLGFLGTFLLDNFLRETYNSRKSELEESFENYLNKKVELGEYSGIRLLGISLEDSKIIDKDNIDSEIKANKLYVGIMPFRSLFKQKWIVRIRPEQTEININNDLTKYNAIIPCGIKDKGIINLKKIKNQNYDNIQDKLIKNFISNLKNLIA